jgi:A/G-specific adenine glycosylase
VIVKFSFSDSILTWFDKSGRKDLPWQQNPTPYRVWVSEIMLQQTQVATVIPYYQRFMERLPKLEMLAAAPLDDVLHLWSGLGYYARARNLHKAAVIICEQHAAKFPDNVDVLQSLPGIGRSTAGAVLSLACGQRQFILDGNVKRVLTRFHALLGWPGQTTVLKQLWAFAEDYTPQQRVADYTQAIMDLGATVCTRSKPVCSDCPVNEGCAALKTGNPTQFPVPRPKRTLPVREIHMVLLTNSNHDVLLQKRPPTGIWGGLWSLPEFETAKALYEWCYLQGVPESKQADKTLAVLKHTFSHFHLHITPHLMVTENPAITVMEADRMLWYNKDQPQRVGVAAPVSKLLNQLLKNQPGI